jgi:ATP/maltotriose-dependent transcriptional regulator MalT
MRRLRIRWTVLLTLLAVLAAAGGVAASAEASLDDLGRLQLQPSAAADLLGPITENGRTGWDCAPERAARAARARDAELPADQR